MALAIRDGKLVFAYAKNSNRHSQPYKYYQMNKIVYLFIFISKVINIKKKTFQKQKTKLKYLFSAMAFVILEEYYIFLRLNHCGKINLG